MLRGSSADIYRYLAQQITIGNQELSLLTISIDTTYSMPTVQRVVRFLEAENYIYIQRYGAGRANRYQLVPEEQRRMRSVAQLVGLIR